MTSMPKRSRKLLLIMPNFFEYPDAICRELQNMGYEVDFFDDRPSTNAWVKAAVRFRPDLIKPYISRYFDKIMQTVQSKKYDVVFLISGQSLSFDEQMLFRLKQAQPTSLFVLYQWDSLRNFPRIAKMHKFFDRCYSFDREDCAACERLRFLPLFYSRRYEEMGKDTISSFTYDFCFVGTAHPQKYKFIRKMSEQLQQAYPKQFIYFYFPSRLVFFYRKLMNSELRRAHSHEFHYVPLTGQVMEQVYRESRCVLDSPQAGQLGLTIRVLEALGAKKKLITTNADVKNYDFYRAENIYVYDGIMNLDDVFFKKPFVEIDPVVYEDYSLRSWLSHMLNV